MQITIINQMRNRLSVTGRIQTLLYLKAHLIHLSIFTCFLGYCMNAIKAQQNNNSEGRKAGNKY